MFEGLVYTDDPEKVTPEKKWYQRSKSSDPVADTVIRRWKPRELPLKSLLHLINQLGQHVDVYTYYDNTYTEEIEHWLFRKGASVTVYSYEDIDALKDDMKYNRDVHTLYTPFEDDAAVIGIRASVMKIDGTWGI